MKRISAVIPVHNAKEDLPRCLDSLLPQLTQQDEILLIEDSSTDGSDALCDSYGARYANVRVCHVRYAGPSPTRNHGLRLAQGQYILFVDADDWVEQDAVAALLEQAADHELVVGGYDLEAGGTVWEKRLSGKTRMDKGDVFQLYHRELLNVLWNKLFRADIIRDNGIAFDEDLKKGEDLLFILRYLQQVRTPIALVDRSVYHYISKESGINRSHRETMDDKRNRTLRIAGLFATLTADKASLRKHMLNMYFRHIRDYLAVEKTASLFRKIGLIRKEAAHPITSALLSLDDGLPGRVLGLLHRCRLDVCMFLLNKLLF
jgi:glycosyltransferase involved in cell wall biosynthesis